MHEVLVNRLGGLGGLSLPGKSVVRLTGRPNMTIDVHRGRKTTTLQQQLRFHRQRVSFDKTTESYEICRLGHHVSDTFTETDRNGRA